MPECPTCGRRFDKQRNLNKHRVSQDDHSVPWQDEELINRLYHAENMSAPEIAEELHCSPNPIYERINETRSIGEATKIWTRDIPLNVTTSPRGYERIRTTIDGEECDVLHHRLLAVAEWGIDAVEDSIVHHKNGVKWDNRPENIELMNQSEHAALHGEEREFERAENGEFATVE